MMETWKTTKDTRMAAALAALGIPVKVHVTVDTRTGKRMVTFAVGMRSADGKFAAGPLCARFKSGRLEKEEAGHRFLTGLRACHSREAMCAFVKDAAQGVAWQRVRGTAVWQIVPAHGNPLPGIGSVRRIFKTGDLKMAVALAMAGYQPLAMEDGGAGRHTFYLNMEREPDGRALVTAHDLAVMWRENRHALPEDEPFGQAVFTLWCRERMLEYADGKEFLLVRKPRSVKSAVLPPDATGKAWDKVEEHFEG
jgi:hypothetical protein